ncbi:MAG: hypothetical protein L0Y79_10010 [Chlorobi bacterium]|nr:hypothetical protein [Chlorobiota bacterium]MCI0715203.1 hypothetical protein [Chlorobiota bacterium]
MEEKEPCTFEEFAKIHATSLKGTPINEETLKPFGINMDTWRKYGAYWYPKLSSDMSLQSKLMQFMTP